MPNNYDIEQCTWCNGQGIDQSYNGKPNPPKCVRCQGSGKIYVTDELATTKRRRKYMGPVEIKAGDIVTDSNDNQALCTGVSTIEDLPVMTKKKRGRPPKVAQT